MAARPLSEGALAYAKSLLTILAVCYISSLQANDLLPKGLQQFGLIPSNEERKALGGVDGGAKPVPTTRKTLH